MDNPDTSSAEWIAEAPPACQGGTSGACQTVPLADFTSVDFTNASATADRQTGSISDFYATAMQLQPGMSDGPTDSTSTASAIPSTLTRYGAGFTVAWQGADDQQETTTLDDGSGYGQDPGGWGDTSPWATPWPGSDTGGGLTWGYGSGF